jgi:hypothetical protein
MYNLSMTITVFFQKLWVKDWFVTRWFLPLQKLKPSCFLVQWCHKKLGPSTNLSTNNYKTLQSDCGTELQTLSLVESKVKLKNLHNGRPLFIFITGLDYKKTKFWSTILKSFWDFLILCSAPLLGNWHRIKVIQGSSAD